MTAEGLANAGNLALNISDSIILDNNFVLDSASTGEGNAGHIVIETQNLMIRQRAQIQASTENAGDGGIVNIKANNLVISNGAGISGRSLGDVKVGAIKVNLRDSFLADNGVISSFSDRSSGGKIEITAGDIRLRGNSDIRTNVKNGAGGGGDINITAESFVAFDDSDIFASSRDGDGGNITITVKSPVFFVNGFSPESFNATPKSLEGNNRADLNATGEVSGAINIPVVNFLPNSLVELSKNAIINTEELVANSCVVRNRPSSGTFIITGKGSLPVRPGNWNLSNYSTGNVRPIPEKTKTNNNWQPGEPIVEPQGIYRLSNGKLVLSRECS